MLGTILWYLFLVALVVVLVVPKYRATLPYFLAFTVYGIVMFFGSLFYLVCFVFKGPSYSNSCEFVNVFRCARWCMGLQPRIYGLDTYDFKKQCLFIINHQSFIDVLSNNHAKALETMREAAELVKRDKINLFMFPEGTRCDTGRLMPFKKGAFHLAIQTQVPLQPIVISCYNKFMNHKEKFYSPVFRVLVATWLIRLETGVCVVAEVTSTFSTRMLIPKCPN
ncbi:unnamed protein product [Dibothriocephalus latus]|uniref:1-acylglycerol-3-phosphate O-acyltransferase n=1 Tax=Dibothriocephalus latus TaxID=60516 RepID=A0A3P7LUJ3_DIBLA|nr:unnamed protein product [Dibothriocephalus latus]